MLSLTYRDGDTEILFEDQTADWRDEVRAVVAAEHEIVRIALSSLDDGTDDASGSDFQQLHVDQMAAEITYPGMLPAE
jgi:hypothetical protein